MVSANLPSRPELRLRRVVGNWKMNGDRVANTDLLAALKQAGPWVAEVAVCVPFPYLADVALSLQGSRIAWGAQDCSAHASGAYTGEVAARDAGRFRLPLRDRRPLGAARLARARPMRWLPTRRRSRWRTA